MLTIDTEKLNNVKQLTLKQDLKPHTLIKILQSEIIDMRDKYTLKEILLMINYEFEMEIKYANFQRTLNRLKETRPSVTQQQNIVDVNTNGFKLLSDEDYTEDSRDIIPWHE